MVSHNSLENYYVTTFSMTHKHNYSLQEIENMIPFERDIYVDMILALNKQSNSDTKQNVVTDNTGVDFGIE